MGHKSLSQQTVGIERPVSEMRTLSGQPLKKYKCAMEPECYREALLSFRAAILLDLPEDKLFEVDQDLVLKESGTPTPLILEARVRCINLCVCQTKVCSLVCWNPEWVPVQRSHKAENN
jgi:hypothetical protein